MPRYAPQQKVRYEDNDGKIKPATVIREVGGGDYILQPEDPKERRVVINVRKLVETNAASVPGVVTKGA